MSRRGGSSDAARGGGRWEAFARFARHTAAVSPVIGTILILVIVVMAMAGILAWGVPAIQALQHHAEYQSVQTQMLELNQEIRNLRDPQNTRVATLSIAGGSLGFGSGDRWAISAMNDATYANYRVRGYEDDDDTILVDGMPAGGTATVAKVVGGRFTNLHEVTSCPVPCTLNLGASGDIATDVLRVQYKESSIVKAETWILDVGRFTYEQDATGNMNHLEMGGSVLEQGTGRFMRQTPTIKEPVFGSTPEDRDFFVRVLQMTGTEGSSGRGEFSILVNLVDNYGVSRGRPLFESAHFVRFQIDGGLEESFCNHFLFEDPDHYSFTGGGSPVDCSGGDVDVLYDPTPANQPFTFELSQAVVSGFVRNA